jgi:hypothetical protein
MKSLLNFLFGKAPDIFDAQGNVLHKFPLEKWQSWNNRFQNGEYDWRKHKGSERIPSKPETKPKV